MRVVIDRLSSDIRMAGYQNSSIPASNAGIVTATPVLFSFASDLNENGTASAADTGELIAYDQYISVVNGINVPVLGRSESGGVHQPAAEDVEHLRFSYLDNTGTLLVPPIDLSKIHFVQVDVVVRASQPDPDYLNTQTYIAADGTVFGGGQKNDQFRRLQQRFVVQCRNVNF
jgi:hypothetical protein